MFKLREIIIPVINDLIWSERLYLDQEEDMDIGCWLRLFLPALTHCWPFFPQGRWVEGGCWWETWILFIESILKLEVLFIHSTKNLLHSYSFMLIYCVYGGRDKTYKQTRCEVRLTHDAGRYPTVLDGISCACSNDCGTHVVNVQQSDCILSNRGRRVSERCKIDAWR